MVADEAVGGEGAEACHYGVGHATTAKDVAFVAVAAQTAASDVATSLRTRPAEEGGAGAVAVKEVMGSQRLSPL